MWWASRSCCGLLSLHPLKLIFSSSATALFFWFRKLLTLWNVLVLINAGPFWSNAPELRRVVTSSTRNKVALYAYAGLAQRPRAELCVLLNPTNKWVEKGNKKRTATSWETGCFGLQRVGDFPCTFEKSLANKHINVYEKDTKERKITEKRLTYPGNRCSQTLLSAAMRLHLVFSLSTTCWGVTLWLLRWMFNKFLKKL